MVEIASEVGFAVPAYFSRFFARLAGQAPTVYRAAIAQGVGVLPEPVAVAPAPSSK
ncbi:MAG: hypothetical protein ABIN37_16385 [Burkholderiaceae bacterium]